jgi:nicotinamidase-related amidase
MKPADLPRSRQALILVDFINPLDFPEAVDLAPHAVAAARATARLKRGARSRGVPVIYANDNFGQWQPDFPSLAARLADDPGPAGVMARALRPRRGDLTVLKPRHSAFYGTPLDILLDGIGARELILTGLATDMCVHLTAADAFLRDYRVHVPENCTAAETPQAKAAALEHMQRVLRCDTRAA